MSDSQIQNYSTHVSSLGILKRSRIPDLHLAYEHEVGENPKYDAAFSQMENTLQDGRLCILVGNRGTGKTQMAALYARDLAKALEGLRADDTPIVYRTAKEMLAEIRISMNETGRMVDKFVRCGLLVIDEIQVRSETEDQRDNLTLLVDRRYGAMRPTLLIGNLKLEQLQTALGTSIVDRVRDGGSIINCDWPSFRGIA